MATLNLKTASQRGMAPGTVAAEAIPVDESLIDRVRLAETGYVSHNNRTYSVTDGGRYLVDVTGQVPGNVVPSINSYLNQGIVLDGFDGGQTSGAAPVNRNDGQFFDLRPPQAAPPPVSQGFYNPNPDSLPDLSQRGNAQAAYSPQSGQGGLPAGARPITLGNGQTVYVDTQGNFFDQQGNGVSNAQVAAAKSGSPAATAQVQTAAQTPAGVVPPNVALQPGMSGEMVRQLQDYLVSQGYMAQEDLVGGYGTYGPKTTAAVAALQNRLGVDNSTGIGFFGPRTMDALRLNAASQTAASNPGTTSSIGGAGSNQTAQTGAPTTPTTDNGKSPVQNVIDTWSEISRQLGLSDLKSLREKTLQDQQDLQNKLDDEVAEINNNPWFSEGLRLKQTEKARDKYERRLNTMSNYAKLYDALYQEGQQQARFMVGEVNDNIEDALNIAQKKEDALAKLTETDNQIVEANGRRLLIDTKTGKTVADLGSAGSGSSSQPRGTITSGGLTYTPEDQSADSRALNNSRGADGYVDPTIYQNLYKAWIAAGGALEDFLRTYPPKNYVNPANTWLPNFLKPSTSSLESQINSLF